MFNKKFSVRIVAGAAMVAALMSFGQANAAGSKFGAFERVGPGSALSGVGGYLQPSVPQANIVVNAAGIASFDAQNAAGNTVLTLNAIPGSLVDAISYNLSIATVGASWLSEATVLFTNSSGDGVMLTPGYAAPDGPGVGTYSDSVLLSNFGLTFNIGSDGLLFVQFFETFDDVAGAADAFYTAGNITFGNIGPVPEPATYGLMALGLLGVVGAARRKASKLA